MRLGDVQSRWTESGEASFYHYLMTANNASGVAGLGQLAIDFNPAFQTIVLHTLRVIRDGAELDKLATVKVRFLQREPGLEHSEYTGRVTVNAVIDDLRVGDTLEYAYSLVGSNPVFKGAIASALPWQSSYPVQLRRVSIQVPAGRPVRYRFMGGASAVAAKVVPAETVHDGLRQITFEQHDLPPLRVESAYPRGYQPATWLQYSEYRSWNQVARWAAELFQMPAADSAAFRNLAARFAAIPDPAKRAAAALDFVQAEIRYTSIAFGESSHRPASPDEVLKRRYGDCKDKSMLLVSLYRAAGLDARPALLSVSFDHGLADWLPAPTPFDHAIVELHLQGGTYWLDPTAHQKPSNIVNVGRLHGGRDALVASSTTGNLQQIEQSAPDLYSITEQVHLQSFEGPALLERLVTLSGAPAESMRWNIAQVPAEEFRRNILNLIRRAYGPAEWAKDLAVDDDTDRNQLTLRETVKLTSYAERAEGGWILRHEPTIASFFVIPAAPHRDAPYGIDFPLKVYFEHRVELPPGVTLNGEDQTVEVKNAFFDVRQTRHRKGSVVGAEYAFETLAQQVPAADMDQFVSDIRKVQTEFHPLIAVPTERIGGSPERLVQLREAAAKADAQALNDLGQLYAHGDGVPQDYSQAFAQFRKAADKRLPEAEFNLGWLYYQGLGTTQDYGAALSWFRKAADKDHMKAQYYTGLMYAKGQGVKLDFAQALPWYRKAADRGYGPAQFDLGVMYSRGAGVPADANIAASWYSKAADQGVAAAQAIVGLRYATGDGLPVDYPHAIAMSHKAAEQGNALGQNTLGFLYEHGAGVERSLDAAIEWYRKAADQDYPKAQFNLGRLYFTGTGVPKDYGQALALWEKAATAGDAAAQNALGHTYESGQGVERNLATAISWYQKSADQRFAAAQNNLGLLYAKGLGVSKDIVQAHMWFNLAASSGDEQGRKNRGILESQMTAQQIDDAQKRARSWGPSATSTPMAALVR